MTRMSGDAADAFMRRYPGAPKAAALDPMFHAETRVLRALLACTDMAMEDEGVPDDIRARVIRSVLFGAMPDVDESAERMRIRDEQLATIRNVCRPNHIRTRTCTPDCRACLGMLP